MVDLQVGSVRLHLSPGDVLPHLVEGVRPGHDDHAVRAWLQAPRHVEGLDQVESIQDADEVGGDGPRRQLEIRNERVDDRHAREQGRAVLHDEVEGEGAGRDDQIDPSGRVFVTQELPHPRAVLRLGKARGIEELREQFRSSAGLGIQDGAEAAHELLVRGLLAVAAPEDEDLVRFTTSERTRRQDQTHGDEDQRSALHDVTGVCSIPSRWHWVSSETRHTTVGDRLSADRVAATSTR